MPENKLLFSKNYLDQYNDLLAFDGLQTTIDFLQTCTQGIVASEKSHVPTISSPIL
jgi:hypothetical protein